MERLDKILSSALKISRADVKKLIKKQSVTVNGASVKSGEMKIDPDTDEIRLNGRDVVYQKNIYLMMNKPEGVISASNDKSQETVVDLVPEEYRRDGLFPAGRLDADTTGFVLITDDGDFAHRILSPKNHVEKTYYARLAQRLSDGDIERFLSGIELKDGTLCLEARLRVIEDGETPLVEVVIHEGKYHQVKRMFAALGNRVVQLRRIKIGGLSLDGTLAEGECREITREEIRLITGE
ncbi:MAG: rRNA pseudouridine synthase [Ruminococcaceae bacterium]|nr:rRNA pseudouridine synthase [Oscillospiraceae bacterium]